MKKHLVEIPLYPYFEIMEGALICKHGLLTKHCMTKIIYIPGWLTENFCQ